MLSDLVVRETGGVRFMDTDGVLGEGLLAVGGTAVVTRALFERNREASVVAYGDGTEVRLFDVSVLDTLERECAPGCGGSGSGLVALEGGSLEATDFEVRRSALAGIQLARRGTIDLHQGVVSDNPIGANVQTEAFDVARLQDDVIYRDNGRNLDSTVLFVPAPPAITTAGGM
jgi:hypothetical protein